MNIVSNSEKLSITSHFPITPSKENIRSNEIDWIEKAVADIKNPDRKVSLQDKICRHVETLQTFSSEQIINLLESLHQKLR